MPGEEKEKEVTPKEVKAAIDALRDETEKFKKGTATAAELKEMEDKTNKVLEASEKSHQKVVADLSQEQKQRIELEERVKDLEVEIVKSSSSQGVNIRETNEYKALEKLVIFGEKGLIGANEFKDLRMDNATSGGYLTTTEMDDEIIKSIFELSPVRQISRVKTVSSKTLEMPTMTSIPKGTYEGEAAEGGEEQPVFGNETLTAYRQTVTVPFTLDVLNDSKFDLLAEINSAVTEGMAIGEGEKFVLGTGSKQPEGFLVHPTIVSGASTTTVSLVISGDDLLKLTGELKRGYKPLFGFNRQTLATLRTLKGSDGQYLWQNTLVPGAPNTIGGNPYVVIQDMPSIAANALSVIYGDFMRGYRIIDRTGMAIIRDDVTRKKAAVIELTFHRYNTGGVVLPEAFVALKVKA